MSPNYVGLLKVSTCCNKIRYHTFPQIAWFLKKEIGSWIQLLKKSSSKDILINFRKREKHRWERETDRLLPVWALTRGVSNPQTFGIWGWNSNQLSYPARATLSFKYWSLLVLLCLNSFSGKKKIFCCKYSISLIPCVRQNTYKYVYNGMFLCALGWISDSAYTAFGIYVITSNNEEHGFISGLLNETQAPNTTVTQEIRSFPSFLHFHGTSYLFRYWHKILFSCSNCHKTLVSDSLLKCWQLISMIELALMW